MDTGLEGSGDMLSTFLHVNGAHTRHRNQLDENTQVIVALLAWSLYTVNTEWVCVCLLLYEKLW